MLSRQRSVLVGLVDFVASRSSSSIDLRYSSSLATFKAHLNEQIAGIREAGTFKNERVIVTKQGSHIRVAGKNTDILNFCANNYLGLSVFLFYYIYIFFF